MLRLPSVTQAKVDLDHANSKGVKPLILAAQYGDIDMVRVCLLTDRLKQLIRSTWFEPYLRNESGTSKTGIQQ